MFQISDFVGNWWPLWVPVLFVAGPAVRVVSSETRAWVSEVREWVQMSHEKGREGKE